MILDAVSMKESAARTAGFIRRATVNAGIRRFALIKVPALILKKHDHTVAMAGIAKVSA